MAPKTVTRQDLLHHIPEDKYLFRECVNYENEIKSLIKINHYDELLPKNDPQFLAPIRRWEKKIGFETPIQWINAILISIYHIIGVVWCTIHFFSPYRCKWQTVLFTILVGQLGGFGITGGAHRYWTHRAFKAKLPLQIIMMIAFSVAGQNNIYNWVRDHRVHHKMSETSADPHDVRRGFFFSHVGWLMMKKHPDVILAGKKIDMSDIMNDPVAKFHIKYFNILKLMCCFILPTITTVYIFGESWSVAILIQCFIRYLLNLHFTWAVNSFAHIWGHKPYNKNHGVSPLHQLLLTLRFYALGTMLISVADFVGVSTSTAGRIVRDISSAIASLYDEYIAVHQQSAEKFYRIARFPRVLAAIDCTHIRIQSPCQIIGEEFRNRKGYFSVQAICDADLRFMNVVARWPGSTHDATIFNNSVLRAQCDAGLFGNRWMLGDSAYPNRSYLLTPVLNPVNEAEQRYNEAHIRTRNTIERLIKPTENWYVSMVAMGEGWHNFHHTFPWDYKAAEFSYFLNTTTLIIDAFASFGWAYDMKVASSNVIDAVSRKQGERYQ